MSVHVIRFFLSVHSQPLKTHSNSSLISFPDNRRMSQENANPRSWRERPTSAYHPLHYAGLEEEREGETQTDTFRNTDTDGQTDTDRDRDGERCRQTEIDKDKDCEGVREIRNSSIAISYHLEKRKGKWHFTVQLPSDLTCDHCVFRWFWYPSKVRSKKCTCVLRTPYHTLCNTACLSASMLMNFSMGPFNIPVYHFHFPHFHSQFPINHF